MWTHTSNSQYTFVHTRINISEVFLYYLRTRRWYHVLPTERDTLSAVGYSISEHRDEQFYLSSCSKPERWKSMGNFCLSSCLSLLPSIYHSIPSLLHLHTDLMFYSDDYTGTVYRCDSYNQPLCYAGLCGPHLQPFTQIDTSQNGKMILHPGNPGSTFLQFVSMYTAQHLASLLRNRWF